ncbi:MAG: hypothetical protein OXF50_04745 [Caldilineaceae bacterium]|nr:hypothetical protein [Caldilineaceae bacterium]
MLLDELMAVIETLKRRIADHGPILRVNETRTRLALIDPLLQVLEWDTTDPSIVIPEYDVNGRKADYALLDQKRRPSATIEAKKLGESLGSHLGQMINYSNLAGIEYAGITDGDQWELYEVFRRGTLDERQLLNVRISESHSYLIALKLLLLWRPNLSSGQVEQASKPIAVTPTIVGPVPPVSGSLDWAPLSKFVAHKTTKLPEFIRFPDGSEHPLQAWNALVLLTVEWLWSMGLLTTGNLSDFSSKERHLVYTEAIHPSGKQFFNPKSIAGTPVVVEANFSRFDSVRRTKDLLSGCGQDLSRVQLGVRLK